MLYTPSLSNRIEAGSIVDDLVRAVAFAIVAPFVAVFWLLSGLVAHWRPVATAAGIVGAVVGCVLCPMLPLGLAITAAVAWITYPRTAVRA